MLKLLSVPNVVVEACMLIDIHRSQLRCIMTLNKLQTLNTHDNVTPIFKP